MNLEDILLRGTRAAQPSASALAEGTLYFVTDEGVIEQTRSSTWVAYSGASLITSGAGRSNLPLVVEAEEPIDYYPIFGPGAINSIISPSSGGGNWNLIESRVPTVASNQDFVTSLDYNEILILIAAVVPSVNSTFECRVSINGGVSYLSTSGDYKLCNANGIEADAALMLFSGTTGTTARTNWLTIINFNGTTVPKIVQNLENTTFAGNYRIPTTSPLNGIRITSQAGTFTAVGVICIFGR